ncbi:MAG: efflux RND transporter permease subunit [Sphaerochaetaceae bacterium]|nr:efflux RND transporter permease subunit [Sphaerochaetaceae bacterium]
MSISKTAVRRPVTVIVICLLIAVLGINAARQLPVELIPDMEIPYLIVSTTYSNAGPEEVEEKVTKILESSLSSVSGLKNMTSKSSKGSSQIVLELSVGTDLNEASNTARDRIDMVKKYLPTDADTPVMIKMDPSMMPLMVIAIDSPNRTPEEMNALAKDVVSPRLEQLDGVASTSIMGGRTRAIKIEIPKDRLQAYGLTFSQIAQMIAAQNSNSSVGTITESGLEYTIEAEGTFRSIEEIGETVISYKAGSDHQMKQIKLAEIADVYDGYKDSTSLFYRSGKECVGVIVSKQSGKNSMEIARLVEKKLADVKKAMPDDCNISIVYDTTDQIGNSISNVGSSAIEGVVLAVLVLLVFLRSLRSTAVIAITIPLSIVMTLLIMYYSGFSLNLMSLAGLALGVGMLVDNAIVILENIFSYRERGTKPTVASIIGSGEMVSAITSSTLTTMCVFIPMVLYKSKLGMIGQVFDQLALTVVISLFSSLALAVTLVPVLTSKYLAAGDSSKRSNLRVVKSLTSFFDKLDNAYANSVRWVLGHKKIFLFMLLGLLVLAFIMIPVVGYTYMPATDQTDMSVSITLPQGTDLETTREVAMRFEAEMGERLKGVKEELQIVGSSMMGMGAGGGNSNVANIMYSFFSQKEREKDWDTYYSAKEKVNEIRDRFPEATIVVEDTSSTSSFGGTAGIDVKISSTDLDACRETAAAVEALLKEKGGNIVTDITSDLKDGLPQLSIIYDREKMYELGVNVAGANAELKANIGGMTCARYSDGGTDIDVIVTLPKEDKQSKVQLEDITVSSSFGYQVPLSSFASIDETRGAMSISRENQARVIHVKGSLVGKQALNKAQLAVQKLIDGNIPPKEGVLVSFAGSFETMVKTLKTFIEIILVAALLVFAVMASQFESFLKPFIVLFTLPLSIIGIVLVYVLTGNPFNVLTAVGLLILVGVVVNNGIVLVDYIGLLIRRGYNVHDACIAAARSRLRPILMTTLTTVLALIPMGFFPGEGGEMVQPIGQTIFGGLTFSTLMTLYLMPCLYCIFTKKKSKKTKEETADAEN